jgi:PAS domain S-box-containing protein
MGRLDPDKSAFDLQRLAREFLREKPGDAAAASLEMVGLHELLLHKIELEMQNEELRRAQLELERSRARYLELYQYSPVSHCSLDERGRILDANLAFLAQVGRARADVLGRPFTLFIFPGDQDIFYLYRRRFQAGAGAPACEVRLLDKDRSPFRVRLETSLFRDAAGPLLNLVVMTDLAPLPLPEEEQAALRGHLHHNKYLDHPVPLAAGAVLSSRERLILLLIGQGQSSREIAAGLALSLRTVDSHRQKMTLKLGLESGHELVKYAIAFWTRTVLREKGL